MVRVMKFNNKNKCLSLVALSAVASNLANAKDIYYKKDEKISMTGVKLGLTGGYTNASGIARQSLNDGDATFPKSADFSTSNTGNVGTTLGYGYTFKNNLHLGAFYDFTSIFHNMKTSTGFDTSGNMYLHSFSGLFGYEHQISVNDETAVVLPFVKVGYTVSHNSNSNLGVMTGDVGHGFNVGGGLMYAAHKNIYAGLEYSYASVRYGDKLIAATNMTNSSNFQFHTIKATLGVKFNLEDLV
jgi:opacity protein-like surface antigen